MGSDILIIARTDALQSYGCEESVRRQKAARDAGCGYRVSGRDHEQRDGEARGAGSGAVADVVEYGGAWGDAGDHGEGGEGDGIRAGYLAVYGAGRGLGGEEEDVWEVKGGGKDGTSGRVYAAEVVWDLWGGGESMKINKEAGGI